MNPYVLGCFAAPLLILAANSAIPARRDFPVDESVKPCDDFYAYACNRAVAGFKLRDDRSAHVFSFNDSSERLLEAKEKWLSELKTRKTPLSPRARELRDVFTACMDPKAGKKEEPQLVKSLVGEVTALKTADELRAFIGSRAASEEYGVFSWGTLPNQDDPSFYDFYVVADLKTLPERSYYDKADVVKDLEGLAAAFLRTIGRDDPEKRAKALVAFEKEFAQSYPLPVEIREIVSSRTGITKKELADKFPRLPLSPLLAKVPDKTHIRHLTPANFEWLDQALVSTPLETLKDAFLFRALPEVMDDAYPALYKQGFEFRRKHLGGPDKRPSRSERCTRLVMHDFEKEIDAELVDVIFPNFPTERFIGLAERVRAAIVEGIESNTWLSPEARAKAVAKMRTAKLQLVKPMNDAEWDFNLPADYAPDRPNANRRLWRLKQQEKTLAELGVARNRDEWSMGPLTVNAYYSPADNKFVMPIGILQYPFFDPKASDEVNLGAVGAVIGHELGHGIDDKGSRYDESGRLSLWMTPADLTEFKQRGGRLVTQFNGVGHNGELTLGENIGDLVGLTFAYRAAFAKAPGATIEAKRSFFTQYARAWCHVMRPKFRELRLKTGPHAMGDARVNQQVVHQSGFVEAFGCKEGDKMFLKAEDRVSIW